MIELGGAVGWHDGRRVVLFDDQRATKRRRRQVCARQNHCRRRAVVRPKVGQAARMGRAVGALPGKRPRLGVVAVEPGHDPHVDQLHRLVTGAVAVGPLVIGAEPLGQRVQVGRAKRSVWHRDGERIRLPGVTEIGKPPHLDGVVGAGLCSADERCVRGCHKLIARLLERGEPQKYTIRMYPTSNVFRAGHRIRIDISSSNFPRFSRNLNTGENVATGTRVAVAHQTMLHNSEYPSHIVLPVIPEAV